MPKQVNSYSEQSVKTNENNLIPGDELAEGGFFEPPPSTVEALHLNLHVTDGIRCKVKKRNKVLQVTKLNTKP